MNAPLQYLYAHVPHIAIGAICVVVAHFLIKKFGEQCWTWVWDTTFGAIKASRQWKHEMKKGQDQTLTELTLQRKNCLTTLQEQGKEQIELLQDLKTLSAEQNGYIKGFLAALEKK